MRPVHLAIALLATASADAAHRARIHAPAVAAVVGRAMPNDNRVAAGALTNGVLVLRLEARLADWHPDADSAPGMLIPAFAEGDDAPQVPGPLVRVSAGTTVEVRVRNRLATDTLTLHGLHSRPGHDAPIVLLPDSSRVVRFRLDAPGTYYYYGSTMGRTMDWRTHEDALLSGAIVVDSAGAPPPRDRIFVIGMMSDTIGRVLARRRQMLVAVNGRSWPYTERLAYAVGDTARWRIVNASADTHPMHLHGFYFRVDANGDGEGDTTYRADARDLAVTNLMVPGSTMRLTWVPERPGNWLFHCHIPEHFEPRGPLGTPPAAMGADAHANHAASGMNGLVTGVVVRPSTVRLTSASRTSEARAGAAPPRHLRLLVRRNAGGTDSLPVFGFALQEGARDPAPDSGVHPGPPLVLVRGHPVRITVVNQLAEPTAVHWHGIELESYFDGVAGFSGDATHVSPLVAPNDSFEVRFTPPRAGTFIYHTHVDENRQQLAGLAGPIVVLEPGARWDPAHDHTVLISSPSERAEELVSVLVNGSATPAPLVLHAGSVHRLRFVNMTMRRPGMRVELWRGDTLLTWRTLAKDGADLPASRRVTGPARHPISIGETLDVELAPDAPGALRVEMRAAAKGGGQLLATWPIQVVR